MPSTSACAWAATRKSSTSGSRHQAARSACLRLAFEAAEKGGAHCITLNAADEIAVEAFLDRRIPFTGIADTIERVLASTPESHPATIAEVLAADREARKKARALVS